MEKPDLSVKNLRKFAVVMAGALVCFALAVWLLRRKDIWAPSALIGGVFLLCGFAAPKLLRPVYVVWMGFARLLGWLNSRILLVVLFYLVITPIGILVRLTGKDLLGKKPDAKKKSYWLEKEPASGYTRQF